MKLLSDDARKAAAAPSSAGLPITMDKRLRKYFWPSTRHSTSGSEIRTCRTEQAVVRCGTMEAMCAVVGRQPERRSGRRFCGPGAVDRRTILLGRSCSPVLDGNFSGALAVCKPLKSLERAEGIEPSYSAWKAAALPLSYARVGDQVSRHEMGLNLVRRGVPRPVGGDRTDPEADVPTCIGYARKLKLLINFR
ncbi:MAG: hypothetical protein JWR89_2906 [Tardiphaga sp.]|nr:hypothetical protein [Tardiphaga sp.]